MKPHPAAHVGSTSRRTLASVAALWACTTLVACGGGGGGGGDTAAPPPVSPAPPAVPSVVRGVAATGAAFSGATVTVTDRRGTVVGTTTTPVGADGAYQITLADGALPPLVLTASRTSASGDVETLVGVLPAATAGTVNLTPLTTLVASRLSANGNPLSLAADVRARPEVANAAAVDAKVAEVRRIVAPVMVATGTTQADLMNGSFAVDGTGQDRLLDAVTVNIIPAGADSANIEVGLKVRGTDGAQPPVIRFTNADNLVAIEAANAAVLATQIPPADVVASGTNVLIRQLLDRLTACHAVPLAERASGATVVAAACRTLFLGDAPGDYLSDGLRVGPGLALHTLFAAAGTGLRFDQGSYESTRANGDLEVGFTRRTPAGAESVDTLVVRRVGDELKLVGNRYAFPGHIYPFMQHRRFDALGTPAYNYRSSGYVTQVTNRVNPQTGVPIFDRVEVVTPGGATLVLRPSAGTQTLVLMRGNTPSNTSYVRLRSVFDAADTAGTPATTDSRNIFFLDQDLTDADIVAIPAQSVWTYRYYLATDPTTVAATQHYRTRARALTIPELRAQTLATVGPQTLAGLTQAAADGSVDLVGLAGLRLGWTVPDGALPPVQAVLFGTMPAGATRTPFTDYLDVASTARETTIPCLLATSSDTHCSQGSFSSGAVATGVYLLARERSGRESASFYATYRVPAN